ncbi:MULTISPECIES: YheC/YheD family protein [unclassified Paenibacillus]|uniref:YheC/YheD family protein n=1 Tax=unclassified Paenibacillus TaxID=185978 RepID=UPI00362B947B
MAYHLDKWTKHKIMIESSELASALPATRVLGYQSFSTLLDQYNKVIVKPSGACGGLGVIQVSSKGDRQYEVHYGKSKKTIVGLRSTYNFVRSQSKRTLKIVQQKIPLAQVNGKPFDVRVMVQRTIKSNWTITGKLAKIAGSGYIITNTARSKGKVVPISTAIRNSTISGISEEKIQQEIDRIALKAVRQLHSSYRWIRMVGLDIGLDSKGNVWIIEANFEPSKALFLHLKDKSIYRQIMSYAKKRRP